MADGIESVDMTGKPESDAEIQNAIDALTKAMMEIMKVPPYLGVYLGAAKRGLEELLFVRGKIKEAKKRIEGGSS